MRIFACLLGLGGLFSATSAHAYQYLSCDGHVMTHRDPINMYMDSCNIPDGGQRYNDTISGLAAWSSVSGMRVMMIPQWGGNDCSITHGDGSSDIAYVASNNSFLDGANGIAMYDGYWNGDCPETHEWDVLIKDSGLVVGNGTELDCCVNANQHRINVVAHELGHVLGMAHETTGKNALMAATALQAVFGGRNRSGAFNAFGMHGPDADDVAFGFHQYLDGNNVTTRDVAASAWKRVSASAGMTLTMSPAVVNVCDGGTTNVSFGWHNRSSVAISNVKTQIFLSTDEVIGNTDVAATYSTTVSGAVGVSGTINWTLTVPEGIGTAAGKLYRVGVIVDPDGSISEYNEYNNATRLPLQLLVKSC